MAHSIKPTAGKLSAPGASFHGRLARVLLLIHLALSPLLFARHTADVFEEPKVAFLSLTALVLLGVAASALLGGQRLRLSWRDPVLLSVLLCTVSALVSTLASMSPHTSWRGAADSQAGLWTILGYLVLFLATRTACNTFADGRRLLTAAVFGAAIASIYAIVQAFGRDPLEWDGVSVFAGTARPFATLGHPNVLGAYLVLAGPLAFAFAERAARARRWFACAILASIGLLSGVVILLTLSRAAWLAAGFASLVLLGAWWLAGAKRASVMLAMGLVLAGSIGACTLGAKPEMSQRVRHLADGSGRWQLWRAAWDVFRDRPVSGSGLDTFRLAFGSKRPADYRQVEGDAAPVKAHNEFLHTLATQGALGGLALAALLAGLGVATVRSWRQVVPEDQPFLAAISAGIAGFVVQNLFGFTTAGCGTLFVTFLALLSRWNQRVNKVALPQSTSQSKPWPLPRLGMTAVTAAVVVFAVIQPYRASVACHTGDRLVGTDAGRALEAYEQAVELDPGNDRYWTKLGAAAQWVARQATSSSDQVHVLNRVRQALERAAALEPADPYHHANLGRFFGELAFRRTIDAEPALREWDAALAADPRNATFLSEAARTAAALGNLDRVRSLTSRGLALYPDCGPLHAQLGACAFAGGCLKESAAAYTEAIHGDWRGDEDGKTRALASLAAVHLGMKQYDQARQFAAEAAARQPDWANAHYLLAQALEGQGQRAEACAEYRRVLTLSPGHPGVIASIDRLTAEAGE
jgi:O-antigen ligase/tetratricopeptide (TPR) repeat protein